MLQMRDPGTEEKLVRENLALVRYAVNEVCSRLPRHVPRDDLESAAMAGLAQAARSFDPDRGIRFDRHASTRIKGALLDELRSFDWASRSVRSKARRRTEATDQLTGRLGRTPTADEVADHLGWRTTDIEANEAAVHRALVLNYESLLLDPASEGVLSTTEGMPEEVLVDSERRVELIDAVAALPERLRHVVVGYFFEEKPMRELARELGVSESRISQMRSEAMGLLRRALDSI